MIDSMNMSTRGVKIETVVDFLAMESVLKVPKVSYSVRILFQKNVITTYILT